MTHSSLSLWRCARAGLAILLVAGAARAGLRGKLELKPCRLPGASLEALCGTLPVPEDRAHPNGRTLQLRVALVPAVARSPKPDALFMLAGGPGQAATEAIPPLLTSAFERIHKSRDIVLVDQRGTGQSNKLACDPVGEEASLQERLSARGFEPQRLRECLAKANADPRLYTTSIAMEDLDEVRAALGYDRIDLWGGSYGTRAALVYLREHGAHARAVVLDGVAPTTMRLPLDFGRDAQRAIELLFSACAADAACAKAWPGLQEKFNELLARFDRGPIPAHVQDPRTGAWADVSIDRDSFTGLLRAELYIPELASLMPLTLERAANGDFAPFVAESDGMSGGFADTMAQGMMLSVLCAEDLSRYDDAAIVEATRGTFLGPEAIRDFKRGCEVWPHADLPAGFGEPVRSNVPVLLLSGELDPVTPPRWADEAKQTLTDSVHFIAPGIGHGVSSHGCAPKLIEQFLDAGTAKGLDGSCISNQKRPPFFVSFAGPTP